MHRVLLAPRFYRGVGRISEPKQPLQRLFSMGQHESACWRVFRLWWRGKPFNRFTDWPGL